MANAEQLLSQAREYHEQGQMQTALDLYRSAVRANPRLADAHTQLGLALNQVGMDAEAVEHLEKSVKLQPTSAEALCNLAMTHRSQFRLDQALDCYERAAWLSKQYPRAVAGAAEIYAITGRQGKAHAMLLPYISSQQDPPAVALTYARCCGAIGKPADGAAAIARHLAGGAAMIPPPARAQMLLTLSRLGHDIEKYQQSVAASMPAATPPRSNRSSRTGPPTGTRRSREQQARPSSRCSSSACRAAGARSSSRSSRRTPVSHRPARRP